MENDCLFCNSVQMGQRTVLQTEHFFMIMDDFPVTHGHALIISNRHVTDIFGLEIKEQIDFWISLEKAKKYLDKKFDPDGYNSGSNAGAPAGQTIFHFHCHLFPRYNGDVEDTPRGGIRNFKKPLKAYDELTR